MPARKSNVSATSAGDDGHEGGGTPRKERDTVRIEDLSLPRTMVQRLAKGVLPPNTMLNKDAVLALQKSATVFINYLGHQSNDVPSSSNRRTIPPVAVFEALKELEFEAFIPHVQAELEKFVEVQANKRNDYRRKVKETKDGGGGADGGGDGVEDGEQAAGSVEENFQDGQRQAKRMRVSEGGDSAVGNSSLEVTNGDESPSAQLNVQAPRRDGWNPDEDPDDEEEEEDGGVGVGAAAGGQRDDEEDEEEEEEDDEDEYPDEGHRAESLELDDPDEEAEKERRRRFTYGPGGEAAGSASSGSEMEED